MLVQMVIAYYLIKFAEQLCLNDQLALSHPNNVNKVRFHQIKKIKKTENRGKLIAINVNLKQIIQRKIK
jgi:hypothetical protein